MAGEMHPCAPRASLLWFAPRPEHGVRKGSSYNRGGNRTDARDGGEPTARVIRTVPGKDLGLKPVDLARRSAKLRSNGVGADRACAGSRS